MEKQCTVMPVTETFMVKHALEITRLSVVKRKTQFAICCIAVKIAAWNLTQKNSTNVDTVNASLAKNIYLTTMNLSYNHTSFWMRLPMTMQVKMKI